MTTLKDLMRDLQQDTVKLVGEHTNIDMGLPHARKLMADLDNLLDEYIDKYVSRHVGREE